MQFKAHNFPKFVIEWKLYDITGMISGSDYMKQCGLSSARFVSKKAVWELSHKHYTMFLLRWG